LSAITTVMVALVLALAVPASQLRTSMTERSCCCPDPSHCHCPDHCPGQPGPAKLRACHQTQHVIVAPTTPAFTQPALAFTAVPAALSRITLFDILAPHAAPTPVRPDAPS
jgi:hypothetical protein